MIISRIANENDFKDIEKILSNSNITDLLDNNSIIYVIKDNSELIGVSQAKLFDNYALLDFIFVDNKYRRNYYGDGLLRSILNYIYNKNIFDIYYLGNNKFLINEGFKVINKENSENLKFDYYENILYLNLNEFFNKECKSRR